MVNYRIRGKALDQKKSSSNKEARTVQLKHNNMEDVIQRAKINPKMLTQDDAMVLQRKIGNSGAMQLLKDQEKAQEDVVQQNDKKLEDDGFLQMKKNNTIQRVEMPENKTGMPDNLKVGVESLSGIDMSDVRVHYKSDKPEKIGALAYTQGTDIHVAPGQEKHLPHEAWHVIQQFQGKVRPTTRFAGMPINDNSSLENEADEMGGSLGRFHVSDSSSVGSHAQGNVNFLCKGTIQCMLEIEDTENKKIFNNSAKAKEYLESKFKDSDIDTRLFATDEAVGRLNEMAEAANDQRYVYPATLNQALNYIAKAERIDSKPCDTKPDQTPQRMTGDAEPWSYTRYSGEAPDQYDVPQTPRLTMFPFMEEESMEHMPVKSEIDAQKERIAGFKEKAKDLGKNQFTYDVKITFRLQKVKKTITDGIELYRSVDGSSSTHTNQHGGDSPYYTSKKIMPAQGGKPERDMEKPIKDELEYLLDTYYRPPFKEASLFHTTNEEKKSVKRPAGDIKRRKAQSLGCSFFHSEVQAAADKEGAIAVGKNAVIHTILKAYSEARDVALENPYQLVILAVSINGYSDPNRVCCGACKPALAHLAEIITVSIRNEIQNQKLVYNPIGLKIRKGSQYSETFNVSSQPGNEFNPKGTGGNVAAVVPTTLTHHSVSEFFGW